MPNPYEGYTAAEQISSTGEGRHVTLAESLMNHPTHADGFVDGKDPVVFGSTAGRFGVGVAHSGASAATDLIAIDTEGIWSLYVVADNDEGACTVEIGDVIYINRTTCVLSKIADAATQIVFGYALTTLASGADGYVAVKVHWMASDLVAPWAALETILVNGALDIYGTTYLDDTAGAITGTLADGVIAGQQKLISMSAGAVGSTVSIAHHEASDPEVATFDAVDEYLLLIWTGTEWATVSNSCTFV